MLYCSVDYDSFELKAWAQVCLWVVGRSNMATVLNEGRDPHTELGARLAKITKPEAYALAADKSSNFKGTHRQTAKIGNFGFQGGMGPKALRVQARAQYKVSKTLRECYELRDAWRIEWPEQEGYFAWVNSLMKGSNRDNMRATIKHFISGRVRARLPYTVASNTPFQGLAADAAKAAGYQLAKECYSVPSSPLFGSRPVIFAHDEYILEVPSHPERAHLAAYRQRDVMVEVAQRYMPGVKVTAKPALMHRLSKKAETVHDSSGLLIPWENAA